MPTFRIATQALGLLALTGCLGGPPTENDSRNLPEPFVLELRAYSPGRSVYYVLEPDGTLRYGGGRHANMREAPHHAGVLTDAQRLTIWRLVIGHDLLGARGQLLPHRERIEYELKLRAGQRRNHLTAADETVPGLGDLDRMLFQIQAENRYGSGNP